MAALNLILAIEKLEMNTPEQLKNIRIRLYGKNAELSPNTVLIDLITAKLLNDDSAYEKCLRMLNRPASVREFGEDGFDHIGSRYGIQFIQERHSARMVISSLWEALLRGQQSNGLAALANFEFVKFLDDCAPLHPNDIARTSEHTLLALLKWAYRTDALLILAYIEKFLLSTFEMEIFNDYQLLHMANRFNFPTLRMKCFSSLRTLDDVETFLDHSNRQIQLSMIDVELLEQRKDHFEANGGGSRSPSYYLWDSYSKCTFQHSIETRYVPKEPTEDEVAENGEDS